MKLAICIAFSLILLCGCSTVGRKLDQTKVEQIKKGETTRDQVLKLIGSPDQIVNTGDGLTIFQYLYVRASAKPATFIPVVGAFAGGVNTQNQLVRITFNASNIVSDVFSSYGGNAVSNGLQTGAPASLPETTENKRPK